MSNDDVIRISDEDMDNASHLNLMADGNQRANSHLAGWVPGKQPAPTKEAVDIILCIDTSGSMEASDYPPTRLQAAKNAALMFTKRKVVQNYNDRVGVIGFGGGARLVHPLMAIWIK